MKIRMAAAIGVMALAAPAAAPAHFILQEPKSAIVENVLGDPQKAEPCGVTAEKPGTPTGAVTELKGGSMLHIKVKETIYHPGYYRLALSVLDRAELPGDPEDTTRDTPRGPWSVSGKIDKNPKPPVLVDGLWEHRTRPTTEFETDVRIPNINCDHCTLQVLQFMEDHGVNNPGRFSYHHCADLKITADPTMAIDKGWPGQGKSKGKAKAKN
ncbi:SCE4755 family polysaccharide monooxygenase-like protein [uncultured Phenylobacterium sp.]|uniref:SCE4755 family polysaccharide monooxygenase-like protein n=1 Tax=uncultured Phenylobacterium sp. TaxID=349273 RepID=UPI0025FBDA6F|nr:SCE4755 family polysaccharide monooxygenase-like protein [uncultured Phenylobacterium sp.]